jgi:hypothetical protein
MNRPLVQALIGFSKALTVLTLVLTLGCGSDAPTKAIDPIQSTIGLLGHDCVGYNYEFPVTTDGSDLWAMKLRSVWQMTSDSTFDAHTIAINSMPGVDIGDTLYWSEGIRIYLIHDDGVSADYITQGNGSVTWTSEGLAEVEGGFPESLRIELDLFDPTLIYTQRPGRQKIQRRDCPPKL